MSQAFDIRPIGPGDIELVARIDPRVAADARLGDHYRDLLGAGLSWAAFDGDDGVGFVLVTRHFFGLPFVDLLFIAGARRRSGAGRALMDHCEAAHDVDRIFTSTNESNLPMRALLDEAGWRPAGVIHYLDPGDPELFFVKLRG